MHTHAVSILTSRETFLKLIELWKKLGLNYCYVCYNTYMHSRENGNYLKAFVRILTYYIQKKLN